MRPNTAYALDSLSLVHMKKPTYQTLKDWRTAEGLSQEAAARKLGMALTTYCRYERGEHSVKGERAKRLMAQTGVSIEFLAGVA